MALEQLAIVLGVVFGFWTGFFTRECEHLPYYPHMYNCPDQCEVPGSASWRMPLAIQILPALILAFGSLVLPPSPRLLVIQGKASEALRVLARLRLRSREEEQTDPILRVGGP